MKYYVKFSNGNEIHSELVFLEENPGEGWHEVSGHTGSEQYKLVNGSAVKLSDIEISEINNAGMSSVKLDFIRATRNTKLANSDWTQMPDSPLSESKKSEWSSYRQQLRDLPSTITDVVGFKDEDFPTPPSN